MKKWLQSIESHGWTLGYIAFVVTVILFLTIFYHKH